MRLMVTGFGPFLEVESNPSGELASRSGCPHRVLDVTFAAVDRFLAQELPAEPFDALLMIGVAARSRCMRLERSAQNRIGKTPDVDGVLKPGTISDSGPAHRMSTLWRPGDLMRPGMRYSDCAGSYLCNYALYRALERFPSHAIGFLHVPSFETVPMATQLPLVHRLIARISAR